MKEKYLKMVGNRLFKNTDVTPSYQEHKWPYLFCMRSLDNQHITFPWVPNVQALIIWVYKVQFSE